MPTQTFTDQEQQAMLAMAMPMLTNQGFIAERLNMTKAEQKAADIAQINDKIQVIDNGINSIDARFEALKNAELAELNAKKTFLQSLKTKIENLPE